MNDSQKARRIYLRNVLISTGVCLFVYIYRGWLFNTVTLKIVSVLDAMIRFGGSGEDKCAEFLWRVICIILYAAYWVVRGVLGLDDAYEGNLRVIPAMYIGYLVLNLVLLILTWF